MPNVREDSICKLSIDYGCGWTNASEQPVKGEKALILVGPKYGSPGLKRHKNDKNECPLPRILDQGDDEDSSLNCPRLFTDWIDSRPVSAWMGKCESWHKECRVPPELSEQLAILRVIDVKRQCLVQAPKSCKYQSIHV